LSYASPRIELRLTPMELLLTPIALRLTPQQFHILRVQDCTQMDFSKPAPLFFGIPVLPLKIFEAILYVQDGVSTYPDTPIILVGLQDLKDRVKLLLILR